MPDLVRPPEFRHSTRRKPRGRSLWRNVWAPFLTGVLLATGVLVGAVSIFAPDMIERGYGMVRATITDITTPAGQLPAVQLGGEGGQPELDACGPDFIEMVSYRGEADVPPVYAAHNYCGGDIILTWQVGTRFTIDGRPGEYEVVEVRQTEKAWVTTEALIGLDGDFALQSCFYGENLMQFVGVRPVPGTGAGPAFTPGT